MRPRKIDPYAPGRGGPKSIAEYGLRITSEWRNSVKAIIETGNLLCVAKKELKHGEFGRLFSDKLVPFSQDTAEKLMAIARNPRITNSANLRNLPPSWSTLYELTRLREDEWTEAKARGLIRGDVLGREIKYFINQRRRTGKFVVFLAALKKVRPAAICREDASFEHSEHVVIRGNQVTAYNGDICISAPVGFDTRLEISTRADTLFHLLSETSEVDPDDFHLVVRSGKSYLAIRSDTLSAWLPVRTELDEELGWYPDAVNPDTIPVKDWRPVPEGFLEGLRLCAFGASRETANTAYNSLCFRDGGIWSTDNARASHYRLTKEFDIECLVPLSAALELCKHELTQYQLVGEWLHFRGLDGMVFSIRTTSTSTETFPDCSELMKLHGAVKEFTFPQEMIKTLRTILVFAEGDHPSERRAIIRFGKGKLTVRGQSKIGWIERTVITPDAGAFDEIQALHINPLYFLEVLMRTRTMIFEGDRALFRMGNFTHMMPVEARPTS